MRSFAWETVKNRDLIRIKPFYEYRTEFDNRL